jgi:hypothetical protein
MDSKQEEIEQLSSLLKGDIAPNQRFLIERELKAVKNGAHGEKDAAYYIDFYYGKSKNWAIIHDLRIEYEDQVAQIDHILINRLFDMYVLESKNYSYRIKITQEGEFQAYYGKQFFGIPSPIEQNKRHIHLLGHFLKTSEILPKRIGITIRPKFKNFILFSPKVVITRPTGKTLDTSMIIKADALKTKLDEEVDKVNPISDLTSMGKISSFSTVEEMANKLASFHKPIKLDFRAKFGLPVETYSKQQESPEQAKEYQKKFGSSKFYCAKCKKPISEKAAKFCWQNKSKFGGKPYCFNCQKDF